MNKFYDTLTNTRGDVLPNYRAQVVNPNGTLVDIFADRSGTPFTDANGGTVNYATADSEGLVQFYWEAATGQIFQMLDPAGDLVKVVEGFADNYVIDNFSGSLPIDRVVDLGDELLALNEGVAAAATTAELASPDPEKGGKIVHWRQSTTGDQLDEINSITLAGAVTESDISVALASAISEAAGRQVKIPAGTWYLDSQITGSTSLNLVLDDNARVIKRHNDGNAISLTAAFENITTVTGPVARGAASLTVDDATGYAAGDDIRLVSADRLPGSRDTPSDGTTEYRKGEALKVASVVGTTINLETPVIDNYTTSIRVGRYQPLFVNIQGGVFEAEEGHGDDPWNTGMIRVSGYPTVNINTTILRSYAYGVTVIGGVRGGVHVVADNFSNNTGAGQFGYVITPTGCSGMSFFVNAGKCRHGFTTSIQNVTSTNTDLSLFGPVRGCTVQGVGYGNMESLIDFHHGSEDCLVLPSMMMGRGSQGGGAFTIRGLRHTVVAPKARDVRLGIYVFTEPGRVSNVAVDGTKGIRIVSADIADVGPGTSIDSAWALWVRDAECTLVGGRYASKVWSTLRLQDSDVKMEGTVSVVPGAAESGSDRIVDCSNTTAITGPGDIRIDASDADDTALGTGVVFYTQSGATIDDMRIRYVSPASKPTGMFTAAGTVRNCDVRAGGAAVVNLGANLSNNSTFRGLATADVDVQALGSNLTLLHTSSRVQIFNTAIAAERTVTMPGGSAQIDGDTWRFIRRASATGAFDIKIVDSGGTIATLSESGSNQWVDIMWSAEANDWLVVAGGST